VARRRLTGGRSRRTRSHDERAIPTGGRDRDPAGVDHAPIAEWLPERYRNVLDRIADLEAAGRHPDADRIRRAAIREYSRRWNVRTAERLDRLAAEASRIVASPVTAPSAGLAGLFRRRGLAASVREARSAVTLPSEASTPQ